MYYSRFFCLIGLIFLFVGSGCSKAFHEDSRVHTSVFKSEEPDYYLLLLVDARGLDYSSGASLLKSVTKHPRDWSKNGDVGHAWILLNGDLNARPFAIEGGHSGELGALQPRYLEGVVEYSNSGNPNPISYLWEAQRDGFFQRGSGGHVPTYAIKIKITKQQFDSSLSFINPIHYDYKSYSIAGNQCCSFVANVARLVGLELDYEVSLEIPEKLQIKNRCFKLREECEYECLTIGSPDILEKSMKKAVFEGKAESALFFYLASHPPKKCLSCKWKGFWDFLFFLPSRLQRVWFFRQIED